MEEVQPKDIVLLQGSNELALDSVVTTLENGRIPKKYIA